MSLYFDMDGNPITMEEWADLDANNRSLAADEVDGYMVSTAFLGLNHNFGSGDPLIFETMVFAQHGDLLELDQMQWRYSTKNAALKGHAKVIDMIRHIEVWK